MKYVERARAFVAVAAAALVIASTPASATIVAEIEPNDTMATAQNLDPNFSLDLDAEITNSTTMAHSSIRAGQAAQATYDFYSFTVGSGGTQGIFDVDHSGGDIWLTLFDSSGTTLFSQDDGGVLDPGSSTGLDPFFNYTFANADQYFVRVGQFPGNAPTAASYILHVSLGAVPEPSTWAMMLLGFAGVGLALRRRRSLQAAAVAA